MKKLLMITLAGLLLTAAGTANAGFTYVGPGGGSEPNLRGSGGILDILYGWSNLTRISDSPYPGDQWWIETNGGATTQAKYARYDQNFGYLDSDGNFQPLVSNITGNGYITISSGTFNIDGSFRFANKAVKDTSTTYTWSSDPSDHGGDDHMVTWKITGSSGTNPDGNPYNNTIGNYVLAWEDLPGLGDQDYQDLVVEVEHVAPIPTPSAILLGSIGVGLVGWLRRRRAL